MRRSPAAEGRVACLTCCNFCGNFGEDGRRNRRRGRDNGREDASDCATRSGVLGYIGRADTTAVGGCLRDQEHRLEEALSGA